MPNNFLINLSFITNQPTGLVNYAKGILPAFKSLHPTVLAADPIDHISYYPIPPNLTTAQGSKGHLRRLIWTQLEIPKIYRKLKASLLFSPIPEAPLYSNCRYIVMAHDVIPLRFPKRNSPLTPYFRYYVPQVLKQSEHILCNSQATAKDLVEFYGISEKQITPIPLAYNNQHFKQYPTLGRKDNCSYFLYIGRHDPHKNASRLVEAFGKIHNSREYELWLVGPTDERYTPTLQAQAKELGLTEQVKFLNYVPYDDLPKIINEAIALVFPSLWEGFGLPILEAMACGTPVITSNLSSLPEVAGEAAIFINPYQTEEITEAMEAIVNDQQLRSHLSTLGLQRAKQFSWEKTGKETVEVVKRYL